MKNGRIMSKANMKLERLLEYLDGMAGTMNYDDNSIDGLEDPRKTGKKYKIDQENVIFEVEEERALELQQFNTMQPGPGMPYVRAAKNNELKVERLNLSAVNDANSQYIGLDLSSDSESNKSSLDDLE